jgi:hypothetical protein
MEMRQQARAALEFARGYTKGLIDQTPTERWMHQPYAGANHVLWNVGHLGVSHHWVQCQVNPSVPPSDERWRKLFARGSTPNSDGDAYTSIAEVRAHYEREWDALLALLERLSDAELAAPVPKEASAAGKNKLGLLYFTAWHEGVHAGEIAAIRKALGLKPKFG